MDSKNWKRYTIAALLFGLCSANQKKETNNHL